MNHLVVFTLIALLTIIILHNSQSDDFVGGVDGVNESPSQPQPWFVDNTPPFQSAYIEKIIQPPVLDEVQTCAQPTPTPTMSRKEFNKNFFNFRDKKTLYSSSMHYDPVDKITDLYLSGNEDLIRNNKTNNIKIKDLFDDLTKAPNLYTRQCVRAPQFDNVNYDNYHMNTGTTGMVTTRTDWEYANENTMNGGKITNTIHPNDLETTTQMKYN